MRGWACSLLDVFFVQPSLASLSQIVRLFAISDADTRLLGGLPRVMYVAASGREGDHVCKRWQGAGDRLVTQSRGLAAVPCSLSARALERPQIASKVSGATPGIAPASRAAYLSAIFTSAFLIASSSRFDAVKKRDRNLDKASRRQQHHLKHIPWVFKRKRASLRP